MAAKKGQVMNPKGRGNSPNKATVEFKEAVKNLINYATPQMVDWLSLVAAEDPNKALDHVYKFAQFGYPLLARSEHTGKNGDPLSPSTVIINTSDPKACSNAVKDILKDF